MDKLIELGFTREVDLPTGLVEYTKIITSNVTLVLIPELNEQFLWVCNLDSGSKIVINTDDLESAISLGRIITHIE